jgi:hypothetical protein
VRRQRRYTFAQTNLSRSFVTRAKAADHTFLIVGNPYLGNMPRLPVIREQWQRGSW